MSGRYLLLDIAVAFAMVFVVGGVAITLGANAPATTIAVVAAFLVYLWVAMDRRARRAASDRVR